MNFGIEHYAASFGDDFDTKINEFKHIKWFPLNFGTLNTTVQVLEVICMLNELIQANKMVFMNFWYIEHYGASLGDDIDAKMNYFKHIKWLFNVY